MAGTSRKSGEKYIKINIKSAGDDSIVSCTFFIISIIAVIA
jgi:hypothetical protein